MIRESFKNIKTSENRKKRIYSNIQNAFDNRSALSKKKFSFNKKVFDRWVPAIAVFCVFIAGFSVYGVSTGLFTGTPYISSKEIEEMYYGNDEVGEIAGSDEDSVWTDLFVSSSSGTLDVFTAVDGVATLYEIESETEDPLTYWTELQEINLMPSDVILNSAILEDTVVTLNFSSEVLEIEPLELCGILKTMQAFYNYEYSLSLMCGEEAVEIDSSYLLEFDYLDYSEFES